MLVKNRIVLGVLMLLVSSCGRKDSDDRFEDACGIELPSDTKVLNDQFADAGKDYGIQYNVVLTDEGMKEFSRNIRKAANFSTVDSGKNNMWLPKKQGYTFYLAEDGVFHMIEVDTTSRIITYSEQG